MKKVLSSILLGVVFLTSTLYANDNDVVVTKSYLEGEIEQLKKELEALTNLDKTSENTSNQMIYKLVEVPEGKHMIGDEGTEVVIRSGVGVIMSTINGGITDVTDGIDLQNGEEAPKYHLLIIPVTEGRGILAESDLVVMVRGSYAIQ